MKKLIFLAIAIFVSLKANSASEKTYQSKVEKATVYLQGAQLFHSIDIGIAQGISTIIVEGVSPYLDQQSLQASGKGNFTIIDALFNVKYPTDNTPQVPKPQNKFVKQLNAYKDSLNEIEFMISANSDRKSQFDIEKNLLLTNRLIKGEFKRDTLALLKDAMEYLRTRLLNINTELLKIKREKQKLEAEKLRLTTTFNELQALANKVDEEKQIKAQEPIYQVVLTVSTDIASTGKLNLSYYVPNASWTPEYELKASNSTNLISLIHKANVQQNTGISWSDVKLTLSSGNPSLNNNKPELASYYLNFLQPVYKHAKSEEKSMSRAPRMAVTAAQAMDAVVESELKSENMEEAKAVYDYTEVIENRTRVDYGIELRYSIPSDGKNHQVAINKKDIEAAFEFYAAPKLEKDAFLMAKITNWEELNLLPGYARIYFDGSYVGKTYINVTASTDTLALNLGRDNSIDVVRKKGKDKNKHLITSNNKTLTQNYSITVRNTKMSVVELTIEDMIPLSNNQEISIKNIDLDGASFDVNTGRVVWKLKLKSHDTKTINYVYEVRYPQDKVITGL